MKKEGKTYEQFLAESTASEPAPPVIAVGQVKNKRMHDTLEVIEVFSGEARITAACKEAGMTTGTPIDIKTGFDMLTVQGQNDARSLIHAGLPIVVFMAPVCTSWSSLSNVLPYEERIRRRDESYPFIEFCSDIAHFQIELGRYFIIENPETSQIWNTRLMQSLAEKHVHSAQFTCAPMA